MRYHPAVRAAGRNATLSGVYDASFGIGHDVRQWRQNWSFAKATRRGPKAAACCSTSATNSTWHCALLPGARVAGVTSLGHAGFPGVDFASRIDLRRQGLIGSVAMDYLSPVSFRRIVLRGPGGVADFDLIAGRYRIDRGHGRAGRWTSPSSATTMFLAAMRDFLHLVAGQRRCRSRHCCRGSTLWRATAATIAAAWARAAVHRARSKGDYA